MTLKPAQILTRLNEKRDHFSAFDKNALKALKDYQEALRKASQEPEARLRQKVSQIPQEDRGAEPLESLADCANWVRAFPLLWQNREDSHVWVRNRLTGVSTFAVDGSQIYPGKDLSIPVALVQIGWFENPHRPDGLYEKDIAVDIMTPLDLKVNDSGEPVDRRVNMRRFEMEVDRLVDYMQDRAGCDSCLVFFDGSLVVTFAEAFDEETRQFYINCVSRLLQVSEASRVPLVAYIDTTYARDLTILLQRLYNLEPAPSMHDAPLLGQAMQWGDRTPLFRCRRPGVLQHYPAQVKQEIAFTYLKAHQGPPVRLELPVWLYETGRHETVLDWVRCEIIVGNGYPYAIETADQTAVLKVEDRQVFFRLLQDWAEEEKLNLRLSRKMVSKVRRR
jgi:hypothetical protein